MIGNCIDDLFDMHFLTSLEEVILDDIPFYTTNTANQMSWPNGRNGIDRNCKNSHRFFGVDIFIRESFNRVKLLHPKAEPFFDAWDIIEREIFDTNIYLERIDINLQHTSQHGTAHTDEGSDEVTGEDYTIMLMNNTKWKPEWGGQFQLLNDTETEVIEEYEYIPGRVLIFPGSNPHRGLASDDPYVYRFTTVFRVKLESLDIEELDKYN